MLGYRLRERAQEHLLSPFTFIAAFFLFNSKFLAPSEAAYCSAILCGPYFNAGL